MSFPSPSPIADDASVLLKPSQAFIFIHKVSLLCTCSDGGNTPTLPIWQARSDRRISVPLKTVFDQ